ncbi:hypothetical protein D3C78_1993330 [compost metagenome]
MVGNETQQPAHSDHGEDERDHEANREYREIARLEQIAVFVARIHRSTDHGRHGQEEREFGRGFT